MNVMGPLLRSQGQEEFGVPFFVAKLTLETNLAISLSNGE